ncbi:hypothetical protein JCM9279_001998 [Rhodotorula babjevae]
MAKKRKHTPEIDLTQLDSASDSSASPEPSTSSSNRRRSKTRRRSPSPATGHGQEIPLHARLAAESSFLAPRSKLFGGAGTGVEDRPTAHLDLNSTADGTPRAKDKGKGKAQAVDGDDIARYKGRPDGTLPFSLQLGKDGSPSLSIDDLRAKLEYGEAEPLRTTYVKEKRGRPKGKGKKKRRGGSSSSSSDDDSASSAASSDDDDDQVGLDDIVGADAGWSTVRALVAAPSFQVPWIVNRFATEHKTKPRDPDTPAARKKQKERKSDKPPKPQKIRLYGSHETHKPAQVKPPLLLLHHEPFTHAVKDTVISHISNGMHASFFLIVRKTPSSSRHHLRLAICTASGDEGCWKKTENAIWVQDFPQLAAPVNAVENPTHTDFSRSFLAFLTSKHLGLAGKAKYSAYAHAFGGFDLSSSKEVQLVTSLAGDFSGEDGLVEAGGLDSLARAITKLEPNARCKVKVEYLTATTDHLPRKFLEHLHAAAQGVPPLEYEQQESARAQHAAAQWNLPTTKDADKVVIVYPTQFDLEKAAGKSKEEQYHVEWRGRAHGALKNSDQRKTVLRKAVMKSGRVNHANMMLIIHQPLSADCVKDGSAPSQYQAFLLVGSHTPTPASWGEYSFSASQPAPTVKVQQHDVSVVTRFASAATWNDLKDEISEQMPYERPLKRYDEDDEPALTAAPRPEPKKRGRKAKEKDD